MTISEKVAYLKGLSEGLGLDTETKEGKLIAAIIETLEYVADSIADIEENALAIGDEIDEISDDLAAVEDIVYEDEECCLDDECECGRDGDEDYGYEDTIYSVKCPTCGEEISIDEGVLDLGSIECPNCGEKLEFDIDGELEEEDED